MSLNQKLKAVFYTKPYDEKCLEFTRHEMMLDLAQTQLILVKVNEELLSEKTIKSWSFEECLYAACREKNNFINVLFLSLEDKYPNGMVYHEPKDSNLVYDKSCGKIKNIMLNLSNSEFGALFAFLQKLNNPKSYSLLKDFWDDVQKSIKNPDFKRIYCQMYRLNKLVESCSYLPTVELVNIDDEKEEVKHGSK